MGFLSDKRFLLGDLPFTDIKMTTVSLKNVFIMLDTKNMTIKMAMY
jgi:hypothetical protein